MRKGMNVLDKLTSDDFLPYLNQIFHLYAEPDKVLDVELIEVVPGDASPERVKSGLRKQAFAITFRGPKDTYLPQRIYRIEHREFGAIEIFLVPIGPDAQGMRYEAVFN